MLVKLLKMEDFHDSSFCSDAIVSTWTALSNCSTFATKVWNSVCSTTVSAGVPNTPTATVQSIKSYSNLYSTGVGIPYFGTVYYGNPPVASSVY